MSGELAKKDNNADSLGPGLQELNAQYLQAYQLVDDIVLKNYITKIADMEIIPLDEETIKNNIAENVRLFKITEMIYQKDEYATYKFATVFNTVSNMECSVFIIMKSDGEKTDFYLGIHSHALQRTTSSIEKTLKNALLGQFPGIKTEDYHADGTRSLIEEIEGSSIAIASSVAKSKDEDITENKSFIQGLEKLAISMQGQRYTGIIIANSASAEQLHLVKKGYENIYTQLSPFAEMQVNFSENEAYNFSKTFSETVITGKSSGTNYSIATGKSIATTTNDSVTQESNLTKAFGAVSAIAPIVGGLLAPITGGASLAAGMIVSGVVGVAGGLLKKTETHGDGITETKIETTTEGVTNGEHKDISKGKSDQTGQTTGTSKSLQLTQKNKTIIDILERIDLQLKRIKEFESLGMWECAAYFLSENQYSAEIAASTYKALMRGDDSGVEVSAVNVWGTNSGDKVQRLKEYVKNFIHPVFRYQGIVTVNACSFVSGNELAIHMGLPRKSVAGFPVIEHAEFGKEVAHYDSAMPASSIRLGTIYDMGRQQKQPVNLGRKSLTMHTFVTGSTGSGKSNTVYRMLEQLAITDIPFLVVEPAKGEYKHALNGKRKISVYGTNPALSPLLHINPFTFSAGIHILEHLDRLVEIFNVCWPMYAAMPAILKNAMEKSYEEAGWDLKKSTNRFEVNLYPSFVDVVKNVKRILDSSEYSDENKGTYKGALVTRLESLTNGINSLVFVNDELSNTDLFDKNVIVDLSRVGSIETKALIMGLLVMKLHEYRMTSGKINSDLTHVTVLEEAHNLLKRTSTEQSTESANLLGKSVEMLANAIAEMRTYGEGFIIADQSPGLLDMSVIRNTNIKIILRLPDSSDRELVGKAASLDENQITEISKLPLGVAAVYQNDWIQPVLCKVEKFMYTEKPYQFEKKETSLEGMDVSDKLIADITKHLLSNMTKEPADTNVDRLIERLWKSNLSTGLKLEINDFLTKRKLPDSISPISEIIFQMYKTEGKAIDAFIRKKTIDNDWIHQFEREIKPCIKGYDGKARPLIMRAIIWEISRQKKELNNLSEKCIKFL